MRLFSQPPWDSPAAATEQKSWNVSSLSRISWNRDRAESIAATSMRLSAHTRVHSLHRVKCGTDREATGMTDKSPA
ncbi:hypothetical protein GCM10010329_70950 [Streptomyces spiroverticillatus]|nr:hypothetical protein GCM10010329_70950 [Streptomyces spiroverticillatus]